jgi:hypothetical protein
MAIQAQEVVILVPALAPLFVALSKPKSVRCVYMTMYLYVYFVLYMAVCNLRGGAEAPMVFIPPYTV